MHSTWYVLVGIGEGVECCPQLNVGLQLLHGCGLHLLLQAGNPELGTVQVLLHAHMAGLGFRVVAHGSGSARIPHKDGRSTAILPEMKLVSYNKSLLMDK